MSTPKILTDFVDLPSAISKDAQDQSYRAFVVPGVRGSTDDALYVAVPGLIELEAVRIDRTEIPLLFDEDHLVDLNTKATETFTHKLVDLVTGPDGETYLVRSKKSNYGKWQAGSTVYVKGKWADETTPKSK